MASASDLHADSQNTVHIEVFVEMLKDALRASESDLSYVVADLVNAGRRLGKYFLSDDIEKITSLVKHVLRLFMAIERANKHLAAEIIKKTIDDFLPDQECLPISEGVEMLISAIEEFKKSIESDPDNPQTVQMAAELARTFDRLRPNLTSAEVEAIKASFEDGSSGESFLARKRRSPSGLN